MLLCVKIGQSVDTAPHSLYPCYISPDVERRNADVINPKVTLLLFLVS